MKNIAFKGDGTDETCKNIINELQKIGGINTECHHSNSYSYYFINAENRY